MTSIEEEYPWLFRLSIYLFYYVLPEYIFKSTLAMRLFNVSLKSKNTMDFKREFFIYSVLVFFDRFLLLDLGKSYCEMASTMSDFMDVSLEYWINACL